MDEVSETLMLNEEELEVDIVAQAKAEKLTAAKAVVDGAIAQLETDAGAVFEDDVVAALAVLRQSSEAEYQRAITSAKAGGARITPLAKLVSAAMKATADVGTSEEGEGGMTELLVNLASSACELFHDMAGACYATFTVDGHRETWPIDSKGFREWLEYETYRRTSRVPKKANMDDARGTIAGKARHEGKRIEVARRVAVDTEGRYLVDLCDDQWRVVKVWPGGWRIDNSPSVRFVRSQNALPLPMPVRGGNLAKLWMSVNVAPADRHLLLTVLLEFCRADTPYPVLELTGQQGSAKSTSQSALRDLIDPNKVNLRGRPKTVEDIFVAAAASHIVSYENLSALSNDQQDAFCTLSTGGGHAGRKLYSNDEEAVIAAKRPVMLNGIEEVVTRPDLADRRIGVELQPIGKNRKLDGEVAREFAAAKAEIFGGLMDLFATCLLTLGDISVKDENLELPRMADFALLGEAVFRTLGHSDKCFIGLYADRRRKDVLRTLDASPTITALIEMVYKGHSWDAIRLSDLLADLKDAHPHICNDAPKSGKGMGALLARHSPGLAMIGIHVKRGIKAERGLAVKICKAGEGFTTEDTHRPCPQCLVEAGERPVHII